MSTKFRLSARSPGPERELRGVARPAKIASEVAESFRYELLQLG